MGKSKKQDDLFRFRFSFSFSSSSSFPSLPLSLIAIHQNTHTRRWNFHSAYGRDYKKSVFVATDERQMYGALAKYPQYKIEHGDGAEYSRYSRDGLDALMVELYSMSCSQYFVGTFSSQVSRMVYELYHTKYLDAYDRAFSLDDPWYGVDYHMVFPMNDGKLEK